MLDWVLDALELLLPTKVWLALFGVVILLSGGFFLWGWYLEPLIVQLSGVRPTP